MKNEVMVDVSPEEYELLQHAKSLNNSVVAIHTEITNYNRDFGIALQLRDVRMVQVDTKGCKVAYRDRKDHALRISMENYKEAIKIALDKLR